MSPSRTGPPARPPGWYADPDRAGSVRWFDGARWSDHRRPDPRPTRTTASAAPAAPAAPPARPVPPGPPAPAPAPAKRRPSTSRAVRWWAWLLYALAFGVFSATMQAVLDHGGS